MSPHTHIFDLADPAGLDPAVLAAANVHPETGLATDFLNPFNEYIMLADLVADSSLPPDVLDGWQPVDYESHFVTSGFTGVDVVLAAYRALPEPARSGFEDATNLLIDLILEHQAVGTPDAELLDRIKRQHDRVGALISGGDMPKPSQTGSPQDEIDKLFD